MVLEIQINEGSEEKMERSWEREKSDATYPVRSTNLIVTAPPFSPTHSIAPFSLLSSLFLSSILKHQIMGRTPCTEKHHLSKGPWSKEEDQLLIHYINRHGEGNWRWLPEAAGIFYNTSSSTFFSSCFCSFIRIWSKSWHISLCIIEMKL